MKSIKALFISLLLLSLFSCKKEKEMASAPGVDPDYDIQINIAGLDRGKAYLSYYLGSSTNTVKVDSTDGMIKTDSTYGDELSFHFKEDSSLKRGLYQLFIPSENMSLDLVINNDQTFTMSSDTSELINHMRIEGSSENDFFYQSLKEVQKILPKIQEIQQAMAKAQGKEEEIRRLGAEYESLALDLQEKQSQSLIENQGLFAAEMMKAGQPPQVPEDIQGNQELAMQYVRANYWKELDMADARLIRTNFMTKKLDNYVDFFIPQQPDTIIKEVDRLVLESKKNPEVFRFVLEHFFNKYAQRRHLGMEDVFVHLLDKYYVSGEAYWAQKPES